MTKIMVFAMLMIFSCGTPPTPTPPPIVKPYTQIRLIWGRSVTPLVTYNLYRSTNSGGFEVLATNLTVTNYSDTALQRKTTYCYKATAELMVESVPTNVFCITTI